MPQWIIAGDKKNPFFLLKLGSDVMDPTMAFTYKEYLNQNLIASQLHTTLNPILTTFLKCLLLTSDTY